MAPSAPDQLLIGVSQYSNQLCHICSQGIRNTGRAVTRCFKSTALFKIQYTQISKNAWLGLLNVSCCVILDKLPNLLEPVFLDMQTSLAGKELGNAKG